MWAKAVLIAMLATLAAAVPAQAASLEPIGSFEEPISVTSDPSDADRLLVTEREGRVMLVEGGEVELYADISEFVKCCNSEQGMSSVVPAPDFPTTGRFYAAYAGTEEAGGEDGEFHVDSFLPGSPEPVREEILAIPHGDHPNHYGGQLHFGPDGMLFVSTGDGGGEADPDENALDLESLLGKILRIDPRPGEVPPYEIPIGNPFDGEPGEDEIWSYGLRNPWRFSFDRETDDMLIADVGQGAWEEVNLAVSPGENLVGGAGAKYGWDCMEGSHIYLDPFGENPSCGALEPFIDPVFDYPHADPEDGSAHGCSITGGFVVRDPAVSDLLGRYVYADFCVGEIRSLLPAAAGSPATDDRFECLEFERPVSFGEDAAGRVYVASKKGTVAQLVPGPLCNPPPPERAPTPDPGGPPPPPPPLVEPDEPRVHLRVVRRGEERRRAILVVRVRPCAGQRGRRVLLKHGGERWKSKRLNRRCIARFSAGRAAGSFRAVLPGDPPQRSQVRTIALAKPTP